VVADQVTGNLGPVFGIYHSLVAFGILGCLCPWVGIDDYPESSKLRRISPPTGRVMEPWIPGELDPAAGDWVTVLE